jgi:hypothetical protein
MAKKVPLLGNAKPIEEYNLDDKSVRIKLGLANGHPSHPPKLCDRYVVYSNRETAVVELKRSSTVHKAIRQLESTIDLLLRAGKHVDHAIIVMKKINRYEKRIYKQDRDNRLVNQITKEPYTIRIGSYARHILFFRESQVSNMYHNLRKYLSEVS